MKKKLMVLIGIMFVLSVGVAIMISFFDKRKVLEPVEGRDKLRIMTSFYPIYMIGLNIAEGIDEIELMNLTDLNTGCLHDYQLTTEDMKNISEADLMIINGGGMEGFLSDVTENYPGLKVIDSGLGIPMLHNGESAEEHEQHQSEALSEGKYTDGENTEGKSASRELTEGELAGEEHDHGEWNAHVWLDPALYIKQIENVRDGIVTYIESYRPEDAYLVQSVQDNAQTYIDQIAALDRKITVYAKRNTSNQKAVIFHDSFAYLANRIGMSVAYSVPLDSDTSLSAGEIAEIVQEVNKDGIRYLFTEEQFSDSIARQIAAETGATMYIIDSVVTGNGSKASYIDAMEANLAILEEAAGGK